MIILGIDPGTKALGYGLIAKNGREWHHVDNGVIIPESASLPERLQAMYTAIKKIIREYRPDAVALEDVFVAKNARSSLLLGHARGVVMLAAAKAHLPVFEYAPASVKEALCGFGQATKEQVQKMIRMRLKLSEVANADASDALAVALCYLQSHPGTQRQGQRSP